MKTAPSSRRWRKRFLLLAVAAGLLWLLFWRFGVDAGPPNPARPLGRVYLIRGQGYVFSGGWRAIRDRLRQAGVYAEDVSDLAGSATVDEILRDHKDGRLSRPLVFVGHSRGGRLTLAAAERLGRAGVTTDLLVTVDVAIPPTVPAGVRRAVNLYLAGKRLYPARPLKLAPDATAEIENIDLNAVDSPVCGEGLNHLNITDSIEIQEYVLKRIMAEMP